MKIEIVRERRKTMVLRLENPTLAVLKVPLRLSNMEIEKFLSSKKAWLEKNAQKLLQNESVAKEFDLLKYIYFDGKIAFETSKLALNFDDLPLAKKKSLVKKYYISQFDSLKALVCEISDKTWLLYSDVKPISSVRVWGSFSVKKVMKLNFKLLCLPKELSEYVICHELCHGVHMNHSPAFWSKVGKICPNYKILRQRLNQYSFLLKDKF